MSNMKSNIESQHQQALIKWAHYKKLPESPDIDDGDTVAAFLFAIPNGGARNIVTAKILKSEGVKKGVHDLMLPLMRQGYAGLWIELKAKGGRATPEQIDWKRRMERAGYRAEICIGWMAAADVICDYLGIEGQSARFAA